jgi:hypothetical protein
MHNSKKREPLGRCGDISLEDPHDGTASPPRTSGARRPNRRLRKLVADPNYPGIKELRGVAEKLLDLFRVK